MRAPRIATAVLALISTALALATAEVVLRFVRTFVSDKPSEFLIPHPILGWARAPGARFHFRIDGEPHQVVYNARGFRDLERTPGAAPEPGADGGGERVVVLGDSFMEAFNVPLEASFARQLETRLRRDRRSAVAVVNLGISGYGTLQETLVYQLEARAHAPALVLLAFYLHNDLRDNSLEIESLRRPEGTQATDRPFLLPGSGWQLTAVEADRSLARYQAALARRRSWWWRAGEVSHVWRLTGAAWIESALRALEDRHANQIPDPDPAPAEPLSRRERLALELDVFSCHPRAEYDRAWDVTARILAQLAQAVRADGAELVVFNVPSVYESEPRLPDAGAGDLGCRDAPPGYARLRGILADLDVRFIDLLPAFQRHARDRSESLFASDSHWNAAGHALAADEVARRLAELSPRGPSDPRSGPATPGARR